MKLETGIQSGYRRSRSYHGTNWVTEDGSIVSRKSYFQLAIFLRPDLGLRVFMPDNSASFPPLSDSIFESPQLRPVCNYRCFATFLRPMMIPDESLANKTRVIIYFPVICSKQYEFQKLFLDQCGI